MKKPEIKDAGAEYAEIWGEAIHSNRHLRVISVGLGIGVLLLIVVVIRGCLRRTATAHRREG